MKVALETSQPVSIDLLKQYAVSVYKIIYYLLVVERGFFKINSFFLMGFSID